MAKKKKRANRTGLQSDKPKGRGSKHRGRGFPVVAAFRFGKPGRGLPGDRFQTFARKIKDGIFKIVKDYDQAIARFLKRYKDSLAKCSQMQLDELRNIVKPLGIGTTFSNVLNKSYLVATGEMVQHLAGNKGITAATFISLSKADRDTLNSGVVLVKKRGRVERITAKRLTYRDLKRVVYPGDPNQGKAARILLPDEQGSRRPRRYRYYELSATAHYKDEETGEIVLTVNQGERQIKVRTTLAVLLRIVDRYREDRRRA